jgi:hypothetical protein
MDTIGAKKIEKSFHTDLSWDQISNVMNSVSRRNPDVVYKLPRYDGHYAEMTNREREKGLQKRDTGTILSGW